MLWIKEVELVDSVDDHKSSCSIRGTQGPGFEVLDARIASVLNRILHDTKFKRKVSLEKMKAQKEDRFLRRRQIADLIYEYFRVTGANDSVENYADLSTVVLRNDDILEFDSKWDEILLSLSHLMKSWKDCINYDYERLRNSMEIHQKKLGPDYHRLKTMVKRSIEQEIRNKNFGIRNGNYEKNAVVKNQRTQQRVQRKGSVCHDLNKRAK